MADGFKRFDMLKKPRRQGLRWLIWLLSFPAFLKHRVQIKKVRMQGLKPPYILLCNHNSFMDFKVASMAAFPRRVNSVVAIDGFTQPIGRKFFSREFLLRAVGCICKRKFTNDTLLVRHLKRVIDNGDIAAIYPEARYSLCGTSSALPESLGKLCKLFGVPVVSLIMSGHHINSPFWGSSGDRGVKPTEAVMTQLFTADEIKDADLTEIREKLNQAFQYDDFAWQKACGIRVTDKKRAEGLHKILYQCPNCRTEFRMDSSGSKLFCRACGKSWTMSELGELSSDDGSAGFSHIPDWYEWERQNVRDEVRAGHYSFRGEVAVKSLPNSSGYIDLGLGTMVHDMNGFSVSVSGKYGGFEMIKPVASLYSCHIELNYLGLYGDCVDLNTKDDTWYIYPQSDGFSVTKIAIATEELYALNRETALTEKGEKVGTPKSPDNQ